MRLRILHHQICLRYRLPAVFICAWAAIFIVGCGGSVSSSSKGSTPSGNTKVTVLATSTANDQLTQFRLNLKYHYPDKPVRKNSQPARAITFQNSSKSRNRYSSSHPARLNLPRKEPFEPSFCMALMAIWRSTARLCGPCPMRVRS
jgi:hypothetical protein